MPDYVFEDTRTKERVELFMDADACVPIGKVIRRDGRRLRRLASYGAAMAEPDWRHVAYQMDDEDAKVAKKIDIKIDPDSGCPMPSTKRQILELEAAIQDHSAKNNERSSFRYDFGQFGRR